MSGGGVVGERGVELCAGQDTSYPQPSAGNNTPLDLSGGGVRAGGRGGGGGGGGKGGATAAWAEVSDVSTEKSGEAGYDYGERRKDIIASHPWLVEASNREVHQPHFEEDDSAEKAVSAAVSDSSSVLEEMKRTLASSKQVRREAKKLRESPVIPEPGVALTGPHSPASTEERSQSQPSESPGRSAAVVAVSLEVPVQPVENVTILPPSAQLASPSGQEKDQEDGGLNLQTPFKTPVKASEKGGKKPKRLFNVVGEGGPSLSQAQGSQTNLTIPLNTSHEVLQQLQENSQTQEEYSPSPDLTFRTMSELLDSEDFSKGKGLLKEVRYYEAGEIHQKIKELLNFGEAKRTNYLSEHTTHVIMGSSPNMQEVNEAKDLRGENYCCVSQDWVTLSCMVGELLPTTPFSPKDGKLLDSVVACLGELPGGDRDKVWAMLTWHGGKVVASLSPEVTHVILIEPQGQLYQDASAQQNIQIVTPDWVQQTIETGSRCNEKDYHPRLLRMPTISPFKTPERKRMKLAETVLNVAEAEAPVSALFRTSTDDSFLSDLLAETPSPLVTAPALRTTQSSEELQQGATGSAGSVVETLQRTDIYESPGKFRMQ